MIAPVSGSRATRAVLGMRDFGSDWEGMERASERGAGRAPLASIPPARAFSLELNPSRV